jgi:hypothetical protein
VRQEPSMGDSNAIGHPLSPVGSLRAVAPR